MSHAHPEIKLKLAGQEYSGVFSTLAFCKLEDEFGYNTLDKAVWLKMDMRLLTNLLWASLTTNHPEVTLEFVRANVDYAELKSIGSLIMKGFQDALPPDEVVGSEGISSEKKS